MKKIYTILILIFLLLCGCSNNKTNTSPEKYYEDFLNNKIPACRVDGSEVWKKDLSFDENDLNCYKVGKLLDVDNDGIKEQLIEGTAGGFYLDYRNNQLYVMPAVDEVIGDMTYLQRDGEYCIVYKDALNSGREYYRTLKYNGDTLVEDIEIKKFEKLNGEYEYYINLEMVSEEAFNEAKKKYLAE